MDCDAPDCRNDNMSAESTSRRNYLKVQVYLLSGWPYLAGSTMSRARCARDHGLAISGATEAGDEHELGQHLVPPVADQACQLRQTGARRVGSVTLHDAGRRD